MKIDCVLHMDIDFEVSLSRLQKRGRPDDTTEVIERRFKNYETATQPILDYLDERGVEIIKIDANQTIEEVHQQIAQAASELDAEASAANSS